MVLLDGMIVLVKDDCSHLAFNIRVSDIVFQLTRLNVTVDDDDAAVALECHSY